MSHNASADDRTKISDATRARMQAKGLQFDVPERKLTVAMEDDFVHTEDYPTCSDPTCCCHRYEHERYLEEARQEKQNRSRKGKRLLEKNYEQPHGHLGENRDFNLFR